jgi:hypothetical protein
VVIEKTGAMKNSKCKVNNPKGACCYLDIVNVFDKYKQERNKPLIIKRKEISNYGAIENVLSNLPIPPLYHLRYQDISG